MICVPTGADSSSWAIALSHSLINVSTRAISFCRTCVYVFGDSSTSLNRSRKDMVKKKTTTKKFFSAIPPLSTMSSLSTTAIQSLDEASRKEIMQFVESEQSKSKVQLSIHNFTDMCFKKCNKDKPITSATLDGQEEACLKNCLNRVLDTNIKVVEALQGR